MFYNVSCSTCGKSYGVRRVRSDANYCSHSCKSKAYRQRRANMELAKRGTYAFEDYTAVKMLTKRYGQRIEDILMHMLDQHGTIALRVSLMAIHECLTQEALLGVN